MKIALRSQANGMLVCADDALGGQYQPTRPLQANRDQETPGGWEIFDLLMQDATGAWVPFAFPSPPVPPTPEPGPEPPTSYPTISSANFTVYGSDPACLDFPATGTFNSWGLVPGVMTIATTGCAHWPSVVIEDGGEPAQSATLWVLEHIDGVWYATGAERLRPEQLHGDKPEGPPPTLIGNEWLYDPARWGPMALHNPRPGEVVGLLLVAGSTRSDNQTPCKERTTPLWIRWPDAAGANPAVLA
jgi:hypothetical protein